MPLPRTCRLLSIVIPIYNEERILEGAVTELRDQLVHRGTPFEIILAENGSRDRTVEVDAYFDNPGKWMAHCHNLEHAELGIEGHQQPARGRPALLLERVGRAAAIALISSCPDRSSHRPSSSRRGRC